MYPLHSTQRLNPTIKSHKMSVPGILASAQAPKCGIGRKEKSSSERGKKEREGDALPSFLAPIPRSAYPARQFFFSPYNALGSLFTGYGNHFKVPGCIFVHHLTYLQKLKETDRLNCGSWGRAIPPPSSLEQML